MRISNKGHSLEIIVLLPVLFKPSLCIIPLFGGVAFNMEKNFLLAICLAAALLFAGCNSPKEGTKETTGTSQVNDAEKNNGEETVSTQKTVTTQKSDSGSQQSGGLLDDLKGLFTSRPGQYMVEYKTSITMKNQKDSTGTMAFYYLHG
jgi:hypothetical protein